jgi:hypothetical protein
MTAGAENTFLAPKPGFPRENGHEFCVRDCIYFKKIKMSRTKALHAWENHPRVRVLKILGFSKISGISVGFQYKMWFKSTNKQAKGASVCREWKENNGSRKHSIVSVATNVRRCLVLRVIPRKNQYQPWNVTFEKKKTQRSFAEIYKLSTWFFIF